MSTYKARCQVIKQLREHKGLTQEEAWEKAGVAQGTYQAMESRKAHEEGREFKDANLEAVATVLGVLLPDIAVGLPQAKVARWLIDELETVKKGCREQNQHLHTPHLLLGMLQLRGSVLAAAIDEESQVTPIVTGLERIVEKIAPDVGPFREFEWEENRYYQRALSYAALELRDANDCDLSLAIFQIGCCEPVSNTVLWVRRRLGEKPFEYVIDYLRDYSPPEPETPPFPQTTVE